MTAACQRWGGWLTEQDLVSYTPNWVEPVSCKFRQLDIFTTPPPSQGFCLLAALQAIASVSPGLTAPFSPSTIHLQLEAVDAALQLGDGLNCDGGLQIVSHALDEMAGFERSFNPLQRQSREWQVGLGRKGDTAHLAVIDKDGLAVSLNSKSFLRFRNLHSSPAGGIHVAEPWRSLLFGTGPSSTLETRQASSSHPHADHGLRGRRVIQIGMIEVKTSDAVAAVVNNVTRKQNAGGLLE
jgi:gamma-glutamyltranspeptidase